MKWFQLGSYNNQITPVEVEKETAQCVMVYNPYYKTTHRRYKAGEFFPTFEAAKLYAVDKLENRLSSAKQSVLNLEKQLAAANALEEPK